MSPRIIQEYSEIPDPDVLESREASVLHRTHLEEEAGPQESERQAQDNSGRKTTNKRCNPSRSASKKNLGSKGRQSHKSPTERSDAFHRADSKRSVLEGAEGGGKTAHEHSSTTNKSGHRIKRVSSNSTSRSLERSKLQMDHHDHKKVNDASSKRLNRTKSDLLSKNSSRDDKPVRRTPSRSKSALDMPKNTGGDGKAVRRVPSRSRSDLGSTFQHGEQLGKASSRGRPALGRGSSQRDVTADSKRGPALRLSLLRAQSCHEGVDRSCRRGRRSVLQNQTAHARAQLDASVRSGRSTVRRSASDSGAIDPRRSLLCSQLNPMDSVGDKSMRVRRRSTLRRTPSQRSQCGAVASKSHRGVRRGTLHGEQSENPGPGTSCKLGDSRIVPTGTDDPTEATEMNRRATLDQSKAEIDQKIETDIPDRSQSRRREDDRQSTDIIEKSSRMSRTGTSLQLARTRGSSTDTRSRLGASRHCRRSTIQPAKSMETDVSPAEQPSLSSAHRSDRRSTQPSRQRRKSTLPAEGGEPGEQVDVVRRYSRDRLSSTAAGNCEGDRSVRANQPSYRRCRSMGAGNIATGRLAQKQLSAALGSQTFSFEISDIVGACNVSKLDEQKEGAQGKGGDVASVTGRLTAAFQQQKEVCERPKGFREYETKLRKASSCSHSDLDDAEADYSLPKKTPMLLPTFIIKSSPAKSA